MAWVCDARGVMLVACVLALVALTVQLTLVINVPYGAATAKSAESPAMISLAPCIVRLGGDDGVGVVALLSPPEPPHPYNANSEIGSSHFIVIPLVRNAPFLLA